MWPWLCIMVFYELIYSFLSPCSYLPPLPPTFLLLQSMFHSTDIITSCKNFCVSPSSDISIGSAFSCDRAFSVLLWSSLTSLCLRLHFPSLLHNFKRKRGLGSKTLCKSLWIIDPFAAPKHCFSTFSLFLFSLQKHCDENSFPLLNSLNIMRCGLKTCLSCQFWCFYPFKCTSDVLSFLG